MLLYVIRHGESETNLSKTWTGWLRTMLDMVVGVFLPRETVCCNNCTVAIFEYTGEIWRLHSWMNLTE